MRISDWSSDVCSSDLSAGWAGLGFASSLTEGRIMDKVGGETGSSCSITFAARFVVSSGVSTIFLSQAVIDSGIATAMDKSRPVLLVWLFMTPHPHPLRDEIGRASCRARVCQSVMNMG